MNALRLFVNGFLIGIANIIPGMSGGTLALVLGIYERLITALRNIGTSTVKRLLSIFTLRKKALSDFRDELRRIDFNFLMILGIGAVVAVLLVSQLMLYLRNEHHDPTYGFFCGLILTSILIPVRMLEGFGWKEFLSSLIAVVLILSISVLGIAKEQKQLEIEQQLGSIEVQSAPSAVSKTVETEEGLGVSPESLGVFFVCGVLTISAMILPGISGSFLLLIFGIYFPLITAINNFKKGVVSFLLTREAILPFLGNFLILIFFALGCLFGLLAFTRLLNFLLKRYRNATIAFLIGLMVGSLYGLWPFREFAMVDGERMDLALILPQLDMNLLITVCVFMVGCGIILGFARLEKETG